MASLALQGLFTVNGIEKGSTMSKHLPLLLVVAVVLTVAPGCNSSKPRPAIAHGERFDCDDKPRSVGQFAQSQAAAGAAADAMLYDRNFRGNALNSLGQSKLDLSLKGTSAG